MAAKNEVSAEAKIEVDEVDSDSSDSDEHESDGTSSDEDNAATKEEIQRLQTMVKEAPYTYDHQLELLKVLRAAGELGALRAARNNMNEIFPLSSELWREWIEDEEKMIGCDEDRDKVTVLYERAVQDYVCPDLWLQYVTFAIGDIGRKGHKYVREVFEKALTAVGLHVTKGSFIWKAYQEFEIAILAGLMPKEDANQTDEEKELQSNQEKTILSLFKRQLSIPLEDIGLTYAEYQSFVEEVDKSVQALYTKTKQTLKKLKQFENDLESSTSPRTAEYKAYIKYELKAGDPSRIQCIFERALVENCLQPDFWLKYGKYLDTTLQSRTASLNMYKRAVRNCPWSGDLWVNHFRALERYNYREHDMILEEFEKCQSCEEFEKCQSCEEFEKCRACGQLSGPEDYLKVWTAQVDYVRRRVDWDRMEEQKERIEDLRKTFKQAVESLSEGFGKDGDPNCTLLMYQARTEAKFLKNMDTARECWNTIMQQGFGSQAQPWLEYFNLERSYGDHKHCKKVLLRAVNSVTDWPEYVVDAFINFEREEGTLEQLEQAQEKCEKQIVRIEERKAKEAELARQKEEADQERLKWSRMSRKRKHAPYCKCCKTGGHETLNLLCGSRLDPPAENVTCFKGKYDVLSNFYPCQIRIWGKDFASTEHAYQYKKALDHDRKDVADRILNLTEARDVKIASLNIKTDHRWDEIKVDLFKDILAAKALYSPNYTRGLLTAKEYIAEAVEGDMYWSTGLSKFEAVCCKVEKWPGKNEMGMLHMRLRKIIKENMDLCEDGSGVASLKEMCGKLCVLLGLSQETAEREMVQEGEQKKQRKHQQQQQQQQQKSSNKGKKDKGGQQQPQQQNSAAARNQESPKQEFPKDTDGFAIPVSPGPKATTSSPAAAPTARSKTPPPGYSPVPEKKKAPPPGYTKAKASKAPPPGYKPPPESEDEPPTKRLKVSAEGGDAGSSGTKQNLNSKNDNSVLISEEGGDSTQMETDESSAGSSGTKKNLNSKNDNSVLISEEGGDATQMETDESSESSSGTKPTPTQSEEEKRALEEEKRKKCTVFVSNLDFSKKEADLTPIFLPYGDLKDIRLLKGFNNKSRGFGYVEFKTEDAAVTALVLDRFEIDGRPMYVSPYREKDQKEAAVKFKYANEMEKNKLFVKNLPSDSTKESVRDVFSPYGAITEVRLVTYRSGQFKGIAFVEFQNADEASKAVFKTDGLKVGESENEISVAISNPPPRNAPVSQRSEPQAGAGYKPSLGGGKKEADRGGRAKTMLAFQPRSLVTKKSTPAPAAKKLPTAMETDASNGSSDKAGTDSKNAGLSNADFRSMLMKK